MADLFVSYKREDRAAVEQIISHLVQEGYSVWWDSRLEAGHNFGEGIAREIDEAKCVIVIWSQASVDSKWVYAEATEADSQGKLIPVSIEPCRVKPPFNILHSFNLAAEEAAVDSPAWNALLKRIRSFAAPAGSSGGSDERSDQGTAAGLDEPNLVDFVRIPAGTSDHQEQGPGENGATAKIAIDYSFALGKFPVTVAEWEAAIADGLKVSPARRHEQESPKLPVVNVSWEDAMQYAAWLSTRTGKTIRLPSETEWEHACRANASSVFCFGDSLGQKQGCCRFAGISEQALPKGPAPVGSFPPNAYGLYDMHGNIWEWTLDCWQPSLASSQLNGSPLLDGDGEIRVIRGGSWAHPPENAGCSARGHARKNSRNGFTGFRLVMECR